MNWTVPSAFISKCRSSWVTLQQGIRNSSSLWEDYFGSCVLMLRVTIYFTVLLSLTPPSLFLTMCTHRARKQEGKKAKVKLISLLLPTCVRAWEEGPGAFQNYSRSSLSYVAPPSFKHDLMAVFSLKSLGCKEKLSLKLLCTPLSQTLG